MKILVAIVLSLLVSSYTFCQENKRRVTSEKIGNAQTFSITADFYNGDVIDFGRGKSDIVKIFPQLKEMKMVKSGGDVIVRITAHEPVELTKMRNSGIYEEEIKKADAIRLMPVSNPSNTVGYYQPLTLSLEKGKEVIFSVRTIGEYFQLDLASNKSSDDIPTGFNINSYFLKSHKPERSVELRNLQRNLKFLEVHLDVLR